MAGPAFALQGWRQLALRHHLDRACVLAVAQADTFDVYLYNTVRFTVVSLEPFLQRVTADSYPYLIRKSSVPSGAVVGSMLLPIPGSLWAIELISEEGFEASLTREWDACSAE